MAEMQILFPMEPKEFWKKLKMIVEEVVMEHSESKAVNDFAELPLLKGHDVCKIFSISKPTLYEWIKEGKLSSIKIDSRRFFRREDVEQLIESSRVVRNGQ